VTFLAGWQLINICANFNKNPTFDQRNQNELHQRTTKQTFNTLHGMSTMTLTE